MLKRSLVAVVAAALLSFAFPSAGFAAVGSAPVRTYPTTNDTVRAIAHRGKVVYLGGDFTRVTGRNGTFVRRGAAAFNVETGRVLRWNPNVVGDVRDIAVGKEGVYLGGAFTRVKGVARRNLARVALGGVGAVHTSFRVPVSGNVKSVELAANRIFLGGSFVRIAGVERNKLGSVSRRAPHRVNAWAPKINAEVMDVVRTARGVYLGGTFTRINASRTSQRLALVTRARGRVVRSFAPTVARPVLDIAVTPKRVFAAGGGYGGGAVYALNRGTGAELWHRSFDGDVQAVRTMSGTLYVGGHFASLCQGEPQNTTTGDCTTVDVKVNRGVSMNGSGVATSWRPELNTEAGVKVFDVSHGRLLVGGGFTESGSVPRRGLAVYR